MSGLSLEGREPWLSAARALIAESGCTVRRWRKNTSGVAYTTAADYGIEAPRPSGPVSFATFAHEVGHQMLHRYNGSYPRWLEELEAWSYALDCFERFDLPGRERAEEDVRKCLRHSFGKPIRRARTPEHLHRLVARQKKALIEHGLEWVWQEGGIGDLARDRGVRLIFV